jgi:adenosylhomocysteine nucleosidase
VILIICAIKPEAKPFLNALVITRKEKCESFIVHHGTINGTTVMVVRCGVGLERAAKATQTMISNFDLSCVVMSGTAGGVENILELGDTIVSEEILYHDRMAKALRKDESFNEDTSFKADETLLLSIRNAVENNQFTQAIYFGRITSGNKFVAKKMFRKIADKYRSLCVDMETAAVAHVCAINKVPFIAVRSITDTSEKSGLLNFYNNVTLAANNSFNVVAKLLNELGRAGKHGL